MSHDAREGSSAVAMMLVAAVTAVGCVAQRLRLWHGAGDLRVAASDHGCGPRAWFEDRPAR